MNPCIVQSGTSPVVRAFGEEATFLLGGAQTGGKFTMFFEVTPPQGGPPPHYHEHEDEWFHVLEGVVSFFVAGAWTDVGPGGAVFVPRQTVHTFKNNSAQPIKMLIQVSPSGFETFFTRSAEEFAKPGGPDMAKVMGIAAEHGIHFV